ncbi:hypothetical protein [Kitasatospora herbaricolor]|uniref:Integral membrane protein n=1 Tax=Kitasatospora herbaricolor TaxID=68217 RepID=A0ABZ1W001_9ACTN|nr:hypothetical protein [Kitasatospora herbaricolor]
MTYRRAAIPALVGGLLLTALLWWAGASTQALHLPGSSGVFGGQSAVDLDRWLAPWSYDPPAGVQLGTEPGASGGAPATGARYLSLWTTAMQIRYGALLACFVPGALFLLRRLPPVRGRTTAALLALWAWAMVAGTLAVTVSAPWLIAALGHGSYRFLPQLAAVSASGRQMPVLLGLFTAAVTVAVARITAKGAGPLPREAVPARAARLAATAGTGVVALSLVVLSYQPVTAALQSALPGGGLLSEPGDLLREWLVLGAWAGPAGAPAGDWLLYRCADAVVLVVVWWALRRLPALLTRAGVPAMAVGAVCATVLGLLAGQLVRMPLDGRVQGRGLLQLAAGIGGGVPAALTCGLLAGVAAAATLRAAAGRPQGTGAPAPVQGPPRPQDPPPAAG